MFPGTRIITLKTRYRDSDLENAEEWHGWQPVIARLVPRVDYVFSSEAHVAALADVLGARLVPVDPGHIAVPITSAQIRENPLQNWRFLPAVVRPAYALRVSIAGAEGTGKSTLAAKLAARYETVWVPEYARIKAQALGRRLTAPEMQEAMRGQVAAEIAQARRCNRLLFRDNDCLSLEAWTHETFGTSPPWFEELVAIERADLTIVASIEPGRGNADGQGLQRRILSKLEQRSRPRMILTGDWETRDQQAFDAVDALLAKGSVLGGDFRLR